MTLTLSILRCPDAAIPESRRLEGGTCVLGRGAGTDWQLADPERILSKRHCVVEFIGGGWQLRDLSTNGTFLNGSIEPVGHDQAVPIEDGDRILLGGYEMEARLAVREVKAAGWHEGVSWSAEPVFPNGGVTAPLPGGFSDSALPFAAFPPGFDPMASLSPGPGGVLPSPGAGTAPSIMTLGPIRAPLPPAPTRSDHTPHMRDAFTPPRVLRPGALPSDWAQEPAPPRQAALETDPFIEDAAFAPPPPLPSARPAMPSAVASQPSAPDAAAALAAFLRGAGIDASRGEDPLRMLTLAGESLRAAVEGLRLLLMARADVKSSFRIEQTLLRQTDNNPLKFAATEEAALAALLSSQRRSGTGRKAVREAVSDLAVHQVAHLAATQAAARALLDRLAPATLEGSVPAGGLLPGAREKRLWEAYRIAHAQLMEQFEDDFDSAFGRAFARAYEAAARRAGRPSAAD
jgi:type VI secretion system protein ImpI/type VI secretion system protein